MKKTILFSAILALGMCLSFSATAQSSSSNSQAPAWSAAQAGLSMQVVNKVLKEAKSHFNVSLGTLISGYCSGSCKVEKVGVTSGGDGVYKVEYGGGSVLIFIEVNS